ncbi:hypothetical protein CRG98_011286 [Punica granatum]|uniref:Inhibitor I9 domain-containing protein n=1 Tax=Punica granatum TaxID=22663 RepID=A0A2I0KIQ2_PUNGR|nr:hypothetical protein CRG98_011286 [Punica granatum]
MAAKDALFQHFCILSVLFLLINHLICLPKDEDRKVYIVYLDSLNPTETYSPTSQHLGLLQQVVEDQRSASASLIRSYKSSFNGFATKLTEKEAQKLATSSSEHDNMYLARILPSTVKDMGQTQPQLLPAMRWKGPAFSE